MAIVLRINRFPASYDDALSRAVKLLLSSSRCSRVQQPRIQFTRLQHCRSIASTAARTSWPLRPRSDVLIDRAAIGTGLRVYTTKPPTNQPEQNDTKAIITERLQQAQIRTKELSQRVKTTLNKVTPHENIYNLPNFLTVTRLFAAPLTAYLLLHDHHGWALGVFAYAGITDLVDGWMARRWKLQTVAGSVIDPMADKALMIILTVTLAVKSALPAYLAALILGRDASLAIAAIWYRYASLPAPRTFARYWDFSLPSAEVHPTTVSKYNTFLQLILIGSTLALPVITQDNHHLGMLHDLGLGHVDLHKAMLGLQILVAGTTVWSGLSYAFLKNAVTILGSNEALKARQGAIGRAIIGVTFGAVVLAAAYLAIDDLTNKGNAEEEDPTNA